MLKRECTASDIRRSYNRLLILSLLGILVGIYCAMLTFINPTPKYEDLLTENIIVDTFGYHSKYRGGGDYYIDTSDGVRYLLNGTFSSDELYESLLSDTQITIKWYQHGNGTNYIKEIKLGERKLSSYGNDDPIDIVIGFAMGGIIISLGIGGLIFRHRQMRKELLTLQKALSETSPVL